jgi:hypothetical protein
MVNAHSLKVVPQLLGRYLLVRRMSGWLLLRLGNPAWLIVERAAALRVSAL